MKTFKFRYNDADGKPFFKTLTLPDDAAQLVGYADGREVFEDDTIIDAYGTEYTVHAYTMGVNDEDCIYLQDSGKLNLRLKEAKTCAR